MYQAVDDAVDWWEILLGTAQLFCANALCKPRGIGYPTYSAVKLHYLFRRVFKEVMGKLSFEYGKILRFNFDELRNNK